MEEPKIDRENMNKIDVLCLDVASITDDDFKEIEQSIQDQREFNIPLLPKTTEWQHQLADFNERVLLKVRELKALLAEGDEIVQPEENIQFFSESND